MRKALIFVMLCLGGFWAAGAQEHKLLGFEERTVNLDTLRYDADSVAVAYWCTNLGDKPVTILEVHSTCGCFTGEASRRVIGPGKRAVVKAWFKPRSLHGPQHRHLTVVATDGTEQVLSSLSVKAYVLRDQSEGEIRFPEELGAGLRTDVPSCQLERDRQGDYLLRIPLYNDTDEPVRVEVTGPSRLRLFVPETIGPRERRDIRGLYNARWMRRGRTVSDTLRIRVNGAPVRPVEFHRTF